MGKASFGLILIVASSFLNAGFLDASESRGVFAKWNGMTWDLPGASCAFDSVGAILTHFEKQFDAKQLSNELGLNVSATNAVSFKACREVIEQYGLIARGFKAVAGDSLIDALSEEGLVALIHRPGRLMHFYVIGVKAHKGLYIIDYPKMVFADRTRVEELLRTQSGSVMIVAESQRSIDRVESMLRAPAADNRAIGKGGAVFSDETNKSEKLEEKFREEISVTGMISASEQKRPLELEARVVAGEPYSLNADLNVINDTNTGIEIREIKGSCGCYSGWTGNSKIEPNASERVEIKFRSETFSLEYGTLLAVRFAKGGSEHLLPVRVKRAQKTREGSIVAVPSKLDCGLLTASGGKATVEMSSFVYVPDHFPHDQLVFKTSSNVEIRKRSERPAEVLAGVRYRVFQMHYVLTQRRIGPFTEMIQLISGTDTESVAHVVIDGTVL